MNRPRTRPRHRSRRGAGWRTLALGSSVAVLTTVTGCGSDTSDRANLTATVSLLSDASRLSADIATYQTNHGTYPQVSGRDLTAITGTRLTGPNHVRVYTTTPTGVGFCLANDLADWVTMDVSTGAIKTTGTTMCEGLTDTDE